MNTRQTKSLLGYGAFGTGIVFWWVAAGPAGAKTIDGFAVAPIIGLTALSSVGAIVWARLERATARATATVAAVTFLTVAFFSAGSSVTSNVWFDRSAATDVEAEVTNVIADSTTAKNASFLVVVRSGTEQFSFPQDLGPGCVKGLHATVRMRAGALGYRWVESARCHASKVPD